MLRRPVIAFRASRAGLAARPAAAAERRRNQSEYKAIVNAPDLSNCDTWPVHAPDAIRPFGYLIAVDPALAARQIDREDTATAGQIANLKLAAAGLDAPLAD